MRQLCLCFVVIWSMVSVEKLESVQVHRSMEAKAPVKKIEKTPSRKKYEVDTFGETQDIIPFKAKSFIDSMTIDRYPDTYKSQEYQNSHPITGKIVGQTKLIDFGEGIVSAKSDGVSMRVEHPEKGNPTISIFEPTGKTTVVQVAPDTTYSVKVINDPENQNIEQESFFRADGTKFEKPVPFPQAVKQVAIVKPELKGSSFFSRWVDKAKQVVSMEFGTKKNTIAKMAEENVAQATENLDVAENTKTMLEKKLQEDLVAQAELKDSWAQKWDNSKFTSWVEYPYDKVARIKKLSIEHNEGMTIQKSKLQDGTFLEESFDSKNNNPVQKIIRSKNNQILFQQDWIYNGKSKILSRINEKMYDTHDGSEIMTKSTVFNKKSGQDIMEITEYVEDKSSGRISRIMKEAKMGEYDSYDPLMPYDALLVSEAMSAGPVDYYIEVLPRSKNLRVERTDSAGVKTINLQESTYKTKLQDVVPTEVPAMIDQISLETINGTAKTEQTFLYSQTYQAFKKSLMDKLGVL